MSYNWRGFDFPTQSDERVRRPSVCGIEGERGLLAKPVRLHRVTFNVSLGHDEVFAALMEHGLDDPGENLGVPFFNGRRGEGGKQMWRMTSKIDRVRG